MNHETTDARRTDQDIYEDVIKANQKRMLKNMNHETTSDTPETDALYKNDYRPNLMQHARKLERERDEARAMARDMRNQFEKASTARLIFPWENTSLEAHQ